MAATAAAADDARVAAHFAAISPYLGADALPCTTLVDRAGTATLMPPRCFQCGMLLNNKQTWYERHKPHMEPLALFEHMHMTMDVVALTFLERRRTLDCTTTLLSRAPW